MLGIVNRMTEAAQVVSVWRPRYKKYDYYLVPRGVRLRIPPPPPGRPAFGEALDEVLPTLPQASVKIGRGCRARGRIVKKRHGGGFSLGAFLGIVLDRLEV